MTEQSSSVNIMNSKKAYSIILRANKGTVSSVFVCVNGNELQMTKIKTTEDFEYFEALLDAGEKMYQYYFKMRYKSKAVFFIICLE